MAAMPGNQKRALKSNAGSTGGWRPSNMAAHFNDGVDK